MPSGVVQIRLSPEFDRLRRGRERTSEQTAIPPKRPSTGHSSLTESVFRRSLDRASRLVDAVVDRVAASSRRLQLDPDAAIEALQRRDGVAAGKNKVVDACGAPCALEFAGPSRERNTLHARSLERFCEGFRLFGIGVVRSAQADEPRAACFKPRDRVFGRCVSPS